MRDEWKILLRFIRLADGGAFLVHKETKHNSRGYGGSKTVAMFVRRERKYEFGDVPQEERWELIKTNGVLKLPGADKSEKEREYVFVIS